MLWVFAYTCSGRMSQAPQRSSRNASQLLTHRLAAPSTPPIPPPPASAEVWGKGSQVGTKILHAMQMPKNNIAHAGVALVKSDGAAAAENVCGTVHLANFHAAGPAAAGSLEPLPAGTVQPKIFDFFVFFLSAEIPVLELRLAEMADSVDGIFVVEADKDFQGNPRELLLRALIHEEPLRSYADKLFIIEVNIPDIDQDHSHYNYFAIQGMILSMLYLAGDVVAAMPSIDLTRDMLIQSDLDEIIGRHALAALRQCKVANEPAWPLMMTDMDYFKNGFRHRQRDQWALGPVLGPVNEVLGSRNRPDALPPHSVFDGYGSLVDISALTAAHPGSGSFTSVATKRSERGIYRPTEVKLQVMDRSEATAWHMSWSLNDEGTARKLRARAGGMPSWGAGLDDAALVAEVKRRRLSDLPIFDGDARAVFTDARRLPDAVKQDPERFRAFLTTQLAQALQS